MTSRQLLFAEGALSGNESAKQESPTNSKSGQAKDLAQTLEQSKVRLEIPAGASGNRSSAGELTPTERGIASKDCRQAQSRISDSALAAY